MQLAIAIVGGLEMLALLTAGLSTNQRLNDISICASFFLGIAVFVLALVK